jgi:glycosyltransferase involved in cell wall biosynthesis
MNLTTIIITKNEEENIVDCIESIKFSKQIIVVDNYSSDRTVEIAKKNGADVISEKFIDFSKQREAGLKYVKCDWILYIDADERVTKELKEEIEKIISDPQALEAYKVNRRNFYLGKHEWAFSDKMERLFKKESLEGWFGKVHESPIIDGKIGELSGFIDHFTHRDLTSMLAKTIEWSDIEAKIRIEASHPKMSWWRFPRVMISTFLTYYIKQKGYKVGAAGLIESIFQSYSTFVTYAKLWEMQNKSTS